MEDFTLLFLHNQSFHELNAHFFVLCLLIDNMLLFRVKIEAQSLDLDHLEKVLTATFFGSIDILPLPELVCGLDF